ncbi:triosephosphate isomerase [Penaeus vannamei]|uniref:Triosephosphate isomerase n=1 Tax=Penaeus vannamei TaxID=6689 RepID=A0A423U0T8_PENVA|nr:triosephosphate isomerase [Penaeus vannamei]
MSGQRKFFVIGNWKMNVDKARIDNIVKFMSAASLDPNTEAVVGCPSCYLSYARQRLPDEIAVAAQNCYKVAHGNFSGEISPAMILDSGCEWVILGHPERRTIFKESDQLIAEKVAHAQQTGIKIIACLCETSEDREEGRTDDVLFGQMKSLAASISDWSPAQVQEALAKLRHWLRANVSDKVANSTRILYAGSVSSSNCRELAQLEDLDGFLVGSAALRPDIVDIINARRPDVSSLIAHFDRPDGRRA